MQQFREEPTAGTVGSDQNVTWRAPHSGELTTPSLLKATLLVLGGSLLIAACAQISLRLPISVVPITLQSFAVLLVGSVLGSRRGTLAVALYLVQGASGLPVFAEFSFGVHHFAGPTGGYLLGFLPAAWLAGSFVERGWDRRFSTAFMGMGVATLLLFLPGLIWLAVYQSLFLAVDEFSLAILLSHGFWPFLPGAVLKATAVALILRSRK